MPPMAIEKLLRVVLALDALLAVGFGLFSWADPVGTYGTIVALDPDNAVAHSALRAMSVFYVVVGAASAVAATLPHAFARRLAVVFWLRHAWVGAQGFLDREAPWLVGDPWPDIVIHAAFVCVYAALLWMGWRARGAAPSDLATQ